MEIKDFHVAHQQFQPKNDNAQRIVIFLTAFTLAYAFKLQKEYGIRTWHELLAPACVLHTLLPFSLSLSRVWLSLFSGCGYLDSVRLKTPHSLDILRTPRVFPISKLTSSLRDCGHQLSIVTTKTHRFGLHSGYRFQASKGFQLRPLGQF